MLKPNRLLDLCSFKHDLVKTKRLLKVISNVINHLNGPIESSERAVTGHLYLAARLIDVQLFHAAFFLPWIGRLPVFPKVLNVSIAIPYRQPNPMHHTRSDWH